MLGCTNICREGQTKCLWNNSSSWMILTPKYALNLRRGNVDQLLMCNTKHNTQFNTQAYNIFLYAFVESDIMTDEMLLQPVSLQNATAWSEDAQVVTIPVNRVAKENADMNAGKFCTSCNFPF